MGALLLSAGCSSSDPSGGSFPEPPGAIATDAGTGADADAGDAPAPTARTRYLAGPRHAPMTETIVARAKSIWSAGQGRREVFAKIGDSITVAQTFLHCFAGADVKLDAYASLEPTRAFFAATLADGQKTSFDRASLAATVGWTADDALKGSPAPIDQEVSAIRPAFAVVMFGTNDTFPTGVVPFERNLQEVIHRLVALGVVPLMSTIPPRGDATANALVPEMNAVVRAVAQSNQVPLMDYHQTLVGLPAYGLAADGIHPAPYVSGAIHACWLTPPALELGSNERNLTVLEALDRAKRFLVDGAPPEAAPPALAGRGSVAEPWIVDALPFVDDADTRGGGSQLSGYACGAQDESGPERVYRVVLPRATKIRARVYADPGVDVDIHWLSGEDAAPARCVARGDQTVELAAAAGIHHVVVDSFVSAGQPRTGAYRLTIVEAP